MGLYPEDLSAFGASGTINEEGRFEIANICPDRYWFGVTGLPEGTYVKRVEFGAREVTRSAVDVPVSGESSVVIQVVAGAGVISGRVMDGDGNVRGNAIVTLAPVTPELMNIVGMFQTTLSGDHGEFGFRSVPPGEYQLLAWEDVDVSLVQMSEIREQFSSSAKRVTVEAKGQASVDLKAVSAESADAECAKHR